MLAGKVTDVTVRPDCLIYSVRFSKPMLKYVSLPAVVRVATIGGGPARYVLTTKVDN